MPVERSAGIIIFRNTSAGRKYLVLRASRSEAEIAKGKFVREFWDFPKGRLETGEQGIDAAKREAVEEAGIEDFRIVERFKKTVRYFTWQDGKPIPNFVAMFLAETKTDKVVLSWEHDKYEWLPYKEAKERITLKEMKIALEVAEKHLKNRN
jgi:8-oxo-dGTP pyrophosphatase MutT (NUDIX family)